MAHGFSDLFRYRVGFTANIKQNLEYGKVISELIFVDKLIYNIYPLNNEIISIVSKHLLDKYGYFTDLHIEDIVILEHLEPKDLPME